MSCPVNNAELKSLEILIAACAEKPEMLNMPQLSFLKKFVEQFGGKVPALSGGRPNHK